LSKVQVDTIDTRSGTSTMQIGSTNTSTINIGVSGDTVNIPSGVTIANAGTATGFGGSNTNLFRAYNNGSQLLNHNTNTVIEMNAESFDVDSKFDTSTYKYTPASVGYYYLNAGLYFNFNDSSLGRRIKVAIHKNGSNIAEHFFMLVDGSADILNEVSVNISVVNYSSNTSDYYQVVGLQNNANGNNNCYVITGEPITYFQGYKLIT